VKRVHVNMRRYPPRASPRVSPFRGILTYLNAKAVVDIDVSDNLQDVRDPAIIVRESTERG